MLTDLLSLIIKSLKLLWQSNRLTLILALFISVVGGLVPAGEVWIFKLILDSFHDLGTEVDLTQIATLFGGLLFFRVIRMISDSLGQSAQRLLSESTTYNMRRQVYKKCMAMPYQSFEDASYYDRIRRASKGVESRPLGLVNALFWLLDSLVSSIGIVAATTFINPYIALAIILSAVPFAFVRIRFENTLWGHRWNHSETLRRLDYLGSLLTTREPAGEVRLYHLGNRLLHRYDTTWSRFYDRYRVLIKRNAFWTSLVLLPSVLALVLVYYMVIRMMKAGIITLGDIGLVIQSVDRLQSSIFHTFTFSSQIFEHSLFLKAFYEFIEEDTLPSLQNGRQKGISSFRNARSNGGFSIEFDRISFKYPGSNEWALREVSFTIPEHSRTALVGENGSGKTTILKLLARLYTPSEGRILLNDRPLLDYPLDEYWHLVGLMFQNYVRYEFSVWDNVTLSSFEEDISDVQVNSALLASGSMDFVQRLPRGVLTQLGRMFMGGVELSGGQWQRLALTRELMKDAPIVLLDEPTASIDPRAESALFEHLGKLLANKTSIFTTHRFGLIHQADQVLVLSRGRLKEHGTHQYLMRQDGLYAELFRLQADRYKYAG